MTYGLTRFDLGDMLKCSLRLRETAGDAPTLEASAQRVYQVPRSSKKRGLLLN
jgi:hypothetical protein